MSKHPYRHGNFMLLGNSSGRRKDVSPEGYFYWYLYANLVKEKWENVKLFHNNIFKKFSYFIQLPSIYDNREMYG